MGIERQITRIIDGAGWDIESSRWTGEKLELEISGPGVDLSLWVEPLRAERACYAHGMTFNLGYAGSQVSPEGLAFLDLMAAKLRGLEEQGDLDGFADTSRSGEDAGPALLYGADQVEIRVTRRCMERCVFCNSWDQVLNLAETPNRALELLEQGHGLGARKLVITGGEPLMVPWITDLGVRARELGMRHICLQTNAVLLARADGVQRLARLAPDDILVSFHGATYDVVGAITGRADLFDHKMAGLRTALESGIPTAVNFVVCKQNLDHMEQFAMFAAGLEPAPFLVSFSFVAPSGLAWENRHETIPRACQAAPALLATLKLARELGVNVVHSEYCGIPTCVEPALREFSEPCTPERPIHVPQGKTKVAACAGCTWDLRCSGIFKRYIELYSDEEFGPRGGGS